MLFDLLELDGEIAAGEPLAKRREALEKFFARNEAPAAPSLADDLRPRRPRWAGSSAAAARSTA